MSFHGTKTVYQIICKHFVAQPKGHMQNEWRRDKPKRKLKLKQHKRERTRQKKTPKKPKKASQCKQNVIFRAVGAVLATAAQNLREHRSAFRYHWGTKSHNPEQERFYIQWDGLQKEEFVPWWWFYVIKDEEKQTDELTACKSYPATDIPLFVEIKSKYDSAMSHNASCFCCDSGESQKCQELHAHFLTWELAIIFLNAEEFQKS